ncbi:choline/carnitine/betaine transport [Saccharopolyspora dendranthemae]|uniref:Choline/carnitine/betaine transport n=2 Tax=Saccharopolyspora dendranthemae TaxID=1181886 RepID=A0A561U5A4_9PSEU|nr:choline/carnitine/betaine transport [Saccharopolyspora dendranthemae]
MSTETEQSGGPAKGGQSTEPDAEFLGKPRTDWVVFGVTAIIMFLVVAWGALATESLSTASGAALTWLIENTGWGFVLAATGFVIFALFLAISKYGRIPLGRDDEGPEFRTVSWIAMMFSAGMGIGLMFFGVSEPLSHFVSPPPGMDPSQSEEAIKTAMSTSLFHWTLHPWAIYAVAGLAIAYSSFRRGRRQTISGVFTPLIGKKAAEGPLGKVIDILALFATLFGSAASLGLGALQIKSGMKAANWPMGDAGTGVLVAIIAVLTLCFILSAVSGVEKGIQWLSNINMVLAAILALFVFVLGPTVFILDLLPTAVGSYLSDFGEMASRAGATGGTEMQDWLGDWTVFYWAWWISWTPFVGMFIARISRGRTIRQFIGGVLMVPSAVSLVWFAIFGGASIDTQKHANVYGDGSPEAQTFAVLDHLPLALVTAVLVMILVAIFFVSGADAASIVMGTLSQRGAIEPSKWVVIFWGAATGAVAAVMLVIGQDKALEGIQNLTFMGALPFAIVMIFMCVAMLKDLRSDDITVRDQKGAEVLEQAVIAGTEEHDGEFQLVTTPAEASDEETESADADKKE